MTDLDINTITLQSGTHDSIEQGGCLLEIVSFFAGEPWSDHPQCVCPVLAAFGRSWNDALDDEARNRILRPFIPKLVGTRSTPEVEHRRAFLAADWTVRTYTPAWFRLAGFDAEAASLEALPEMTSTKLCEAAMPTIHAAWDAAGAAAWAAWDAAGAAAWAAWDAARDAAWAAWDAARAAAGDAWDAWAAGAAARARLAPVVELLQVSAADLLERMIAVTA